MVQIFFCCRWHIEEKEHDEDDCDDDSDDGQTVLCLLSRPLDPKYVILCSQEQEELERHRQDAILKEQKGVQAGARAGRYAQSPVSLVSDCAFA